jgi:hypothetical protein
MRGPMNWKMRAAAAVIGAVFLIIVLRPPAAPIEAGLLALGLASAAYYVKLHRQLHAEKDQQTDPS